DRRRASRVPGGCPPRGPRAVAGEVAVAPRGHRRAGRLGAARVVLAEVQGGRVRMRGVRPTVGARADRLPAVCPARAGETGSGPGATLGARAGRQLTDSGPGRAARCRRPGPLTVLQSTMPLSGPSC